jgi:hypothetical protein
MVYKLYDLTGEEIKNVEILGTSTPHSLLLPQSPSILLSQRAATVQESAGARKHWGQAALKKYYARSTVYINSFCP